MKRPFIYCISMASEKELSNLMCTGREETAAAFLLAREVGTDRWTGRRYYDASSRKDNRSRSASYWTSSRARFAKYVSLRRKALAGECLGARLRTSCWQRTDTLSHLPQNAWRASDGCTLSDRS